MQKQSISSIMHTSRQFILATHFIDENNVLQLDLLGGTFGVEPRGFNGFSARVLLMKKKKNIYIYIS